MTQFLINSLAIFGCLWLIIFLLALFLSMWDIILGFTFWFGGIYFFIWSVNKVLMLFGIT